MKSKYSETEVPHIFYINGPGIETRNSRYRIHTKERNNWTSYTTPLTYFFLFVLYVSNEEMGFLTTSVFPALALGS